MSQLLNETITAKEILKEAKENKGKIMVSIGATVLIEAQITDNKTCKEHYLITLTKKILLKKQLNG